MQVDRNYVNSQNYSLNEEQNYPKIKHNISQNVKQPFKTILG